MRLRQQTCELEHYKQALGTKLPKRLTAQLKSKPLPETHNAYPLSAEDTTGKAFEQVVSQSAIIFEYLQPSRRRSRHLRRQQSELHSIQEAT